MAYYAVTTVHGPNWDASRERRDQDGWNEHAAFMDGLVDDGFVVLGGPIGDQTDVLLLIEADTESDIADRFSMDPWFDRRLLAIGEIGLWLLWLDGRTA